MINYSAVTKTIPARGKALVSTDLAIAVPEGTYGRVAPRSGLGELCLLLDALHELLELTSARRVSLSRSLPPASKFMIDTGAGVIDADYRGTVHVLLFNLSDVDYEGECCDKCFLTSLATAD